MDKHKPYQPGYNFSDIERYLKGELSPAEMHALEKAALSDPFLADAIEGYGTQSLRQSQSDLTAIREMIAGHKEEEARIITLPRKPIRWQMIAAVLILVCATSIVFLLNQRPDDITTVAATSTQKNIAIPAPDSTTSANETTPLAATNLRSSQKSPDRTTPPAASAPASADMAMAPSNRTDSLLQLQQATAALMEKERIEALKKAEMQTMSRRGFSTPSPMYDQTAPLKGNTVESNRQSLSEKNVYLIKGQVIDQQQQPIANARLSVKDNSTTQIIQTDQQGRFSLPSSDSIRSLQVNMAGYEQLNARIASGKANRMQLIPDSSNKELKEVVVSSFAPKRVTSISGAVMQTKNNTTLQSDSVPLLRPSIGMKALQEKIQAALLSSSSPKDLPLQDITVQLRFNQQGELSDIVFPEETKKEIIDLITPVLKSVKTWYIGKDRATGTRTFILPIKGK
jgi:hypothetical protein